MHEKTLSAPFFAAKIISKLTEKFGHVPANGILAGQAVSSAILEILNIGHGPYPYNDLDIFGLLHELPSPPDSDEGDFQISNKSTLFRGAKDDGVRAFDRSMAVDMLIKRDGSEYRILSSHIDPEYPFVNYIACEIFVNDYHKRTQSSILEMIRSLVLGFDINCCQVGIDLQTNTLYYSPAFLDFLYSKRLTAVFFGTPMHTAVRLLKKRDALPFAKIDVPYEMDRLQFCVTMLSSIASTRTCGYLPGNLFSPIYLARYQAYSDELNKYFSVQHKPVTFNNVMVEKLINDASAPFSTSPSPAGTSIYNEQVTRDFYILISKKDFSEEVAILKALSAKRCEHPESETPQTTYLGKVNLESFSAVADKFYHNTRSDNLKRGITHYLEHANADSYLAFVFISLTALTKITRRTQNIAPSKLANMSRMVNKHPLLLFNLCELDSVEDMAEHLAKIRYMEKNGMSYRIGFYESMDTKKGHLGIPEDYWLERRNMNKNDFPNMRDKDFSVRLQTAHEKYIKQLKAQTTTTKADDILTPLNKTKMVAKELSCAYSLYQEGEDLGHCVGGYFDHVERGDIIISLCHSGNWQNREDRSTLSLVFNEVRLGNKDNQDVSRLQDRQLCYVQQHFGVGNRAAPKANVKIAEIILREVVRARRSYLMGKMDENATILNSASFTHAHSIIDAKSVFFDDDPDEDLPF